MEKSVIASKQGLRFTFVKLKANGQTLVGEMAKRKDGLNFSQINLATYKEATMNIDYNKKVLLGVALALYIFYKMMGG